MTALLKKYYTAEEYLEMERVAPYKSEYFEGQIYPMGDNDGETPEAMAGAKPSHNTILENISIEVGSNLKKRRTCRSYSSDQRVHIPSNGLYTYPDLVVVCGKPEFTETQDCLTNPILIVEVLSKSTANYDRSEKFELYRDIQTFKEYLLIDSRRVWAELWRKNQDNIWSLVFESKSLDTTLYLESIDTHLSLNDLYINTEGLIDTVFEIR